MANTLDYFQQGMQLGAGFSALGDLRRERKKKQEIEQLRKDVLGATSATSLGLNQASRGLGVGLQINPSIQYEGSNQSFSNQFDGQVNNPNSPEYQLAVQENEQRMIDSQLGQMQQTREKEQRLQSIDPQYGEYVKQRKESPYSQESVIKNLGGSVNRLLSVQNDAQLAPAILAEIEGFRANNDMVSYEKGVELYNTAIARPDVARKQLTIMNDQLAQMSQGKQFADSKAFTSTLDDEGNIVQGFAVSPQSGNAYFQPIGGSVKERPQDSRERDLQARKELEAYKTTQAFLKEMNSQTQTPKGRLELSKLKLEDIGLNASKQAEQMEAVDALNTVNRLATSDLSRIYGRGESIYPELLRTQDGIDRIADRDQVVSLLKMASRQKLKGQGTISEGEGKMLGDAATILSNPNISSDAAARELERVMPIFSRILPQSQQSAPTQQGIPAAEQLKALESELGL